MNRKPQPRFEPSSPVTRTVFVAAALVATVVTGNFIDALAQGLGTAAPLTAHAAPVVVAQR
jgi:hypothetical protein